ARGRCPGITFPTPTTRRGGSGIRTFIGSASGCPVRTGSCALGYPRRRCGTSIRTALRAFFAEPGCLRSNYSRPSISPTRNPARQLGFRLFHLLPSCKRNPNFASTAQKFALPLMGGPRLQRHPFVGAHHPQQIPPVDLLDIALRIATLKQGAREVRPHSGIR